MRVKLFSQGAGAAIQSLENQINGFLESARGLHVKHVTLSGGDTEKLASVWYDEAEAAEKMAADSTASDKLPEMVEKEMVEDA